VIARIVAAANSLGIFTHWTAEGVKTYLPAPKA
jgi:hypothetical protein